MLGSGPQLLRAAGLGRAQMGWTARSAGEGSVPHTWPHVLQGEVLIRKAASVDGLPSCAIVVGEVASLHTEYLVTNYTQAAAGQCPKKAAPILPRPPQAKSQQISSDEDKLGKTKPRLVHLEPSHSKAGFPTTASCLS